MTSMRGGEQDHDLAAELVGEALRRRPGRRRSRSCRRGGRTRRRRPRSRIRPIASRLVVLGDVRLAAGSRSARPGRRGTGSRTSTSAVLRAASGRRRSRRRTGRCRSTGPAAPRPGSGRSSGTAGGPAAARRRGALERLDLLEDRLVGPRRRLVDERRRAEDDPRRTEVGDVLADRGRVLAARRPACPARQVSSASRRSMSLGQHQLLQIALGEDDDRVVAEPLAELLGPLEGGRAVVDELVGARVRATAAAPRRRSTIATTETTPAIVAAGWVTDHSPMRPSRRRIRGGG